MRRALVHAGYVARWLQRLSPALSLRTNVLNAYKPSGQEIKMLRTRTEQHQVGEGVDS
jgi:hypothetical protein